MGVFKLSANHIIGLIDKRFQFLVMRNKNLPDPHPPLVKMNNTLGNVSPL